MHSRRIALVVVCLLLAASTPARMAELMLIPAGAVWKYNDSGANLGTAWRAVGYNDTAWAAGPAQLGYGDGGEATVISFGPDTYNKFITSYFRRSFNVANLSQVSALTVRYVRDDGCVIYLNGVEVLRSNLPAGTIVSTTLAPVAIGGADESAWLTASIDPALLVAGTNVLAVEVHQQASSSSDVSFDLELRATESTPPAPTVALSSPAHLAVSNQSATTFTAALAGAAGLEIASLYLKAPPRTLVLTGPSQVLDAQISADTPTIPNGSGASVNVDGSPHAHGLMKFPTLIGSGTGQVPAGSLVTSATLQLNCTNPGHVMRLYRLTQDWIEDQATWTSRATGVAWASVGADGAGSNASVAVTGDCTTTGLRSVDLTRFVQEWSDGSPNYGVVMTDSGTDGVDFTSSESASSPILNVLYQSTPQLLTTLPVSGTTANVSFPPTSLSIGSYRWNVLVTDVMGQQSWAPSDFDLTIDAAAPDAPVAVSPLDGAVNVSGPTSVAARVSDPSNGSLTVNLEWRRQVAPEFTIIALPDTQHYSEAFPAIYTSQTQWIVDNKQARNIVFVTHEGDIVEHYNLTTEWDRANASMSLLDGVVPYGMGPGNHDQPTTLFNQYFPYTRYLSQPWYGGHYQNLNDNNFELFSGGGMDFVIAHLEFCPSAGAVSWADSVFKSFPNRIGIMTTHGYLNESAQRTVSGCTNTQYLWDGLAVPNPNLHFMLSGHVHDESRRTDVANGHPVFQMLADYQDRASGGEGWLRILRFAPADDKVYVQTYSPWLNRFESDANSEFTLDFPMGGAFTAGGSTVVSSGATATFALPTLEADTTYEWRVTVTNSAGKARMGPVWTFTTAAAGPGNQPPVATNQSINVSEDLAAAFGLSAYDPEGGGLTYSILTAPTHGALSGTAPALTYAPAANFNGADSFTFQVSDGLASSAVATVSITIGPVNDPPTAVGESYVAQAGGTLTVGAPGVLGNDSDIEGSSLTTQVVAAPSHGTLSLAANGSFTYTPSSGYSGPDAFTYRASDGTASSAVATVTIDVQVPAPVTVFAAAFNTTNDSFNYADNFFRGATQSNYASGTRIASGGFTGGALQVLLGGVDNTAITNGMSGGWRRTFTLSAPANVTLSFRYNLNQGAFYESDEASEVLAAMDGVFVVTSPVTYVARVVGDGDGGAPTTTGWQLFTRSLGTLPAGTHNLIIGGYNNKKNAANELTTILIDDVMVTRQ